jgi:hypothetical protein
LRLNLNLILTLADESSESRGSSIIALVFLVARRYESLRPEFSLLVLLATKQTLTAAILQTMAR